MAKKYYKIQKFIQKYKRITISNKPITVYYLNKSKNGTETKTIVPGIYLQSLCFGLEDGCEEYLTTVSDLEQKITNNKMSLLSYVLSQVESHTEQLNVLLNIIETIESQELHGCQILGLLHEYLQLIVYGHRNFLIK